ncbi:MAG: MFS transporter [candidate division WS1 bacterium]|jgi:MFS family permease|nr:MFS transporter [candidate division WS1 bacterium]
MTHKLQSVSTPPAKTPAFSRRIYLLSAIFFFIFMGAGAQQAYLVSYLGDVTDWSDVACSAVLTVLYFAMLAFRIINVYLFAHWSDRRFTIIGSLTYLMFTIAMFLVPYYPSYPIVLVMALIWGAGGAMMWTGTAMQTLELADKAGSRHGTGMGILYSSTHGGWLVGAIVLGLIYQALPVEQSNLTYVAASVFTAIGIVLAFLMPATGQALRETPSPAALLEMTLRARAAISGILQLAAALAYGFVLGMMGKYVKETFGAEWIWISIALYPATRTVLSVLGGHVVDRVGHTPVLMGSFLIGAAGLLVAVLWHSAYAVMIAGFTLGLLGSMVPVVASAIVGNAANINRRPLAYGVMFAWRDLGIAVAAVGSNILGLSFDGPTVFSIFAYIFVGCAILSIYLGKFADQEL